MGSCGGPVELGTVLRYWEELGSSGKIKRYGVGKRKVCGLEASAGYGVPGGAYRPVGSSGKERQ